MTKANCHNNFQIAKKYRKPFYSYKFEKSGFRYEVGLCSKTGDICWWAGPYLPGIWNDEMIFRDGLANLLEPGEKVKADGGYWGSMPELVKCPRVAEEIPNNVEMQQRIRSHQETVNE